MARKAKAHPLAGKGHVIKGVHVDTMVAKYLETAAWAECDPPDVPVDKFPVKWAPEAVTLAYEDCIRFLELAEESDLKAHEDGDAGEIAHDFWLTRRGHGAGFWDRAGMTGVDETVGERLTEIAKKFSEEIYPYRFRRNGLVHFG